MGRRKKGRCVKNNKNVNIEPEEFVQAPHSFVIHKGLAGGNLIDLTKDFRKIMEPFTAKSLKERKKNAIKDFVAVAGLLHVSHLTIFSRTEMGMYLKTCKLPRGPSMTFKIHNFSLARDVVSSLKKQNVVEAAFKHAPLIILNGFTSEEMRMKLMASMFQNMFPTINLTDVDLNNVRRCVLLNYSPVTNLIDLRHYTIKVIPVGISKGVKKVVHGKVPNLTRFDDISEFLTKSGVLSESEAEDDPSNHITLPQQIKTRGNIESGKSTIKLSELGPRLSLQLIKIEDGLLDGEVLYHDFIEKTSEEKLEIQKNRDAKRKLKENRKKVQEKNKQMKEKAKQVLKERSMRKANNNENAEAVDDDAEYYKQELDQEPDKDLFTSTHNSTKQFPKGVEFYKRKRKLSQKNVEATKRFKKHDSGVKKNKNYANRDKRPTGPNANKSRKKQQM